MKKLLVPLVCLFLMTALSGCGLMEDAFKAGFIIALVIAAIIGLLIWILHLTFKILSKYFPAVRVFCEGFWEELSR
jgi:flagellar biosynthesis protein FliR